MEMVFYIPYIIISAWLYGKVNKCPGYILELLYNILYYFLDKIYIPI